MRRVLGALLRAGHDVRDLAERYTWAELGLLAGLADDAEAEVLDLVVVPLYATKGVKFKGYATQRRADRAKAARKRALALLPPEVRDDAKLRALARLGIGVRTERVAAPAPEGGGTAVEGGPAGGGGP